MYTVQLRIGLVPRHRGHDPPRNPTGGQHDLGKKITISALEDHPIFHRDFSWQQISPSDKNIN